ncbi:MAG: alpha-mannosidase [Acidimicrobiales bacterium]
MSSRRVAIVPHTHWDREWYEPFQTFRLKLVELLDGLLDLMESDPSYARFLLDGQMAVVDDYLEVRPEAEGRIRDLAATGRLTMGPWYILMDEFLVSGETIVRNLQMGIKRGAAFGGVMEVGYLPDMFGHIAQMPQILAQAGLEHAVVWRGVPSSITKTGFWWEAPDGSTVRAEYLPVGYSNGSVLPDDGKALVRRVEDHELEIGSFLFDRMLIMNGSDHLPPQPGLGRTVADANASQDDYVLEITSLPEYLGGVPTDGLERWKGELRSGARANVLMGVTSNRVDIKQAAAVTERELERRAEPYAALFLPPHEWPARLLELSWLGVVRNSAHDSICACSVDEVDHAVVDRFAESRQIAEGVASRALTALARSMAEPGPVVVNPAARPRAGTVELVVAADEPPGDDVQVVSERFGLPGSMTLDAETVKTILGMLQGPKIDNDAWVQEVRVEEDDTGIDLTVVVGPEEHPNVPIAEAKADLYTRLGARPGVMVRVSLDQPPIRRIAARVDTVAGFGWRPFTPAPLANPATVGPPPGQGGGPGAALTLTNGLVTVAVDPADGTFAVNGLSGFGRLVDGGDLGDSYNYSPPGADSSVDRPESVEVAAGERGPVRATAVVTATYRWPDHVDGSTQARVGEHLVTVTTTIEVRADESTVRVTTRFVNPARDHRLRAHFPLPERARSSEAECAFGTVVRGLTAEGRSDEFGLPTFPSRRFVRAGGLTVVHQGLNEYELVDIDEEGNAASIALTLLRSTGMLSRVGMAYRPFPAGPLTAADGLQLAGRPIESRYAVAVGPVDPYAMADDVLLPLEVVNSLGGGTRPSEGSALGVSGAEVSALRREAGALELRVHNPSDSPSTVRVAGRSGWLVDLRGKPTQAFDETFELRPSGIATLRIDDI